MSVGVAGELCSITGGLVQRVGAWHGTACAAHAARYVCGRGECATGRRAGQRDMCASVSCGSAAVNYCEARHAKARAAAAAKATAEAMQKLSSAVTRAETAAADETKARFAAQVRLPVAPDENVYAYDCS